VDRCWKQGLPAQRGSRADHFSGQMLEEARGEEPGDERTSSGISLSTCVNYSLHCVDFLPSRPLRKWGRRSCARGCTRPVRHGCTVTRGGKLADAGRCLRQGFQGKLKNSPAQSGRNRLRCAPSRPPCRAPVRQADRRASARGGVFAHVASVAPLLHSSRAWPHVASRVLAHVAPDLFGLWHRISRHAPGHMALMCSALGHSGGRLRPAE